MILLELFLRFVVISLLAFGGGQAALPLLERMAVDETGWIAAPDFAAAVAFGYITPGPVLIIATFVGYRAAGIAGAIVATLGVFLCPWALAALAARQLRQLLTRPWLRAFGRGAAPAVVGLLGVTALGLARHAFVHWAYAGIAALALALALRTKVHPALIVAGGALLGVGLNALPGVTH